MTKYCGIADAHGIESFIQEDDEALKKGTLQLRAQLNRQRHACYYEVELEDDVVAEVKVKIDKGDFQGALNVIKGSVDFVGLVNGYQNSWELIPNSKLDPWGGE